MELVTGRAGSPHITSQQDRQKHQGIWGTGAYILKTGNNLEPVVQSSNSIQIKDGALMSQGALFSVKVGTVDEVTIANGSQGMMRKDVIVARYTYNQCTNTEKAEWAVVQGTPAASNPQIPQITEGDIQAGDATVDTSVFIVTLDGINITAVDVVPETAPDMEEIKAMLDELNGKTKKYEATVNTTQGSYIHFARIGNLVYATHIAVFSLPSANVSHIIATIPSGYRPNDNVYATEVTVTSDAITGNGRWSFGNNGDIRLIASTTTIAEHSLTLCYLTDDAFPDN